MKIAVIVNTSWNIYNFRLGLLRHFLDRGDEVVAVAPRDNYSEKLVEAGCTYEQVAMQASGMNPLTDLVLALRLWLVLKKHRPEVVLTYTIKPNIYGSLACGLLGIPCICNVSGLGTVFLWKGYVKKIAISLYTFAFRFNSWIFFQNEEDKVDFLRQTKVDPARVSVLPGSGVDTDHFGPRETPPNAEVTFLMIARLLVEKGVYDYIEAIRILKKQGVKAAFMLVGSLDESHSRSIPGRELQQWIEEGLVVYTSHAEDIRPFIGKADAVVLPSYREGTPKTLLEAGAMGKALIATAVPGCRQVVIDGVNGFLCELKNPKDLAFRMKLYLSLSQAERRQMSESARNSIMNRYDQKLVIDQYSGKIEELTRPV